MEFRVLFLAVMLFLLPCESQAVSKVKIQSSSLIAVDFRDAPLRDVVFQVSEISGRGFAFGTVSDRLSWSWRGRSLDIIPVFEKVIARLGYGLVQESPAFYQIQKINEGGLDLDRDGFGVFPLQWSDTDGVTKALEIIFAGRGMVSAVGSTVVISGGIGVVGQCQRLIEKLDKPLKGDFEVIPVQHIPLKRALEALRNIGGKEGEKEGGGLNVFPDYWNRSLVVRGSRVERLVSLGVVALIDRPGDDQEKIIWLHNLDGEKAATIVADLGQGVYVKPFGDSGLLLSGPAWEVERIAGIIQQLDGAHIQIRVQATIAQLSDSAFEELGIALKGQSKLVNSSINGGGFDLLSAPGSGLLFDFIRGDLSGVVKASNSDSRGEILSSPILTVLNGQTGKIMVGQNVPFLGEIQETETGTETRAVHRENVGVSLEITASLEREGIVLLKVKQEVSSVSPETVGAVDLITDKKAIETTVLIPSGETVFLGGLRSEESGKRVERVPLLGWLPIVGKIFSFKTENRVSRHLVVSIRPEIIKAGFVQ
ncbi:MAG: hypothetical protein HQL72_14915 [Magnetococcales bacterium]|nr:hypothetical protein [Magnetococcales bacterium]